MATDELSSKKYFSYFAASVFEYFVVAYGEDYSLVDDSLSANRKFVDCRMKICDTG